MPLVGLQPPGGSLLAPPRGRSPPIKRRQGNVTTPCGGGTRGLTKSPKIPWQKMGQNFRPNGRLSKAKTWPPGRSRKRIAARTSGGRRKLQTALVRSTLLQKRRRDRGVAASIYAVPTQVGNWKAGGSPIRSFIPKQDRMRLTFSLFLGMMNGKEDGGNGVWLITPEFIGVDAIFATPGPTDPEPPLGSASTF